MKKFKPRLSYSNWENIDDSLSIRFFAEKLEELLFNYSLNTYKYSALSLPYLVIELLDVIGVRRKGYN